AGREGVRARARGGRACQGRAARDPKRRRASARALRAGEGRAHPLEPADERAPAHALRRRDSGRAAGRRRGGDGRGRGHGRRARRRDRAADVPAVLARRPGPIGRRLGARARDRAGPRRGAGRQDLGGEPPRRRRARRLHATSGAVSGGEKRYGRRGFLLAVAGGLSSLAWAGPVSRALSPVTSGVSQLVGDVLPVGGWRIYTISGTMPVFDPGTWRLEIGGLVKRPRSLSYEELLALPRAEQVS